MVGHLSRAGASVPRRDVATVTTDALALLFERGLLCETPAGIQVKPDELDVLKYYGNSIARHLEHSVKDIGNLGELPSME